MSYRRIGIRLKKENFDWFETFCKDSNPPIKIEIYLNSDNSTAMDFEAILPDDGSFAKFQMYIKSKQVNFDGIPNEIKSEISEPIPFYDLT